MAEFLDGNSSHAHFAPLSQAQTVAISRHLQEQITALQGRLDDVLRQVQSNSENIGNLRSHKDNHTDTIGELKDGLTSTKSALDTTRQNLNRTNNAVQQLTDDLEKANQAISQQGDAQRVARTGMERMDKDLSGTSQLASRLQEAIERRVNADLDKLRADLNRTNLELDRLREDEEAVKSIVGQEREASRQLALTTKNLAGDLANSNTKAEIHETRLGETVATLKATQAKLDDLSQRHLALTEDHGNTLTSHQDLLATVKKTRSHLKNIDEHVQRGNANLGDTQQRLDNTNDTVDELAAKLQQLQGDCQNTSQGHGMLKNKVHQLQVELSMVASTAEKVKAGLKETSSILLPNISMESEVSTRTMHHGSILHHAPLPLGKPSKGSRSPASNKPPSGVGGGGGGGGGQNGANWT